MGCAGAIANIHIELHPDVHLDPAAHAGGVDVVRSGERVLAFNGLGSGEQEALAVLAGPGAPSDELADGVLAADGSSALATWYFRMEQLDMHRALRYSVREAGRCVIFADPVARQAPKAAVPVGEGAVVLSRFSLLQRRDGGLVLESPRSGMRVTLESPEAAVMAHRLSRPGTLDDVADSVPGLAADTVREVLSLLLDTGHLTRVDAEGAPAEEADAATRLWEVEDLRFHAHSRMGHHDGAFGGVFPFREEMEPLPPVRPRVGTAVISLNVPDAAALAAADPTLFEVMEARRSIRPPSPRPVTLAELATVLYRTARGGEIRPPTAASPYAVMRRPHPSGGATYPLEWYVVVRSCEGLPAGIYHYLPDEHALEEVPAREGGVEALAASYGLPPDAGSCPVVLVLTARFGRMSWKYRSVAYSLILKEVGVVQQSLYLVATAMGLAPCALGSGNDRLFGEIVGLAPLEEAAVGEFMVGGGGE